MADPLAVSAWMPLYGADFMMATLGWTADAVGHYIRLLLVQWDRGHIPGDPEQWESISPGASAHAALLGEKFLACPDGLRRNSRVEVERAKAMDLRRKRVQAGNRGAKARWNGDEGVEIPPVEVERVEGTDRFTSKGDVSKAWGVIPARHRKSIGRFRTLWVQQVVRPGIDPDLVIKTIADYYESPQGLGQYARSPWRLLQDEAWNDSRESWGEGEGDDRAAGMQMVDEILKGEGGDP